MNSLFLMAALLLSSDPTANPLAHWRAARQTNSATVVVIGDSISEGSGTEYPFGYVDQLKIHFRERTGDAGSGYVMPHNLSGNYVGAWQASTDYAPIGDGMKGTGGATLTFAAPSAEAIVIFYAWTPDSAPFTVSVGEHVTLISGAIMGVNRAEFPVNAGDRLVKVTAPEAGYLHFLHARSSEFTEFRLPLSNFQKGGLQLSIR